MHYSHVHLHLCSCLCSCLCCYFVLDSGLSLTYACAVVLFGLGSSTAVFGIRADCEVG